MSEEDEARRAEKPHIRAQVWDVENLPRVSLNDVLSVCEPISVGTEMGHEYIVVTPRSGNRLPEMEDIAPVSYVQDQATVEKLHQFQMQEMERGYQMALQDFGLPPEKGPQRTGISSVSGQTRPHDRVNFARGVGVAGESDMTSELGTAVASPWTAWTRREYNSDLYGYKGLRIYDKMRKSDGSVRGTLRLAKTPVLAGQWGLKPASQSTRDINIANFVWKNLTVWMSQSLSQFITESMLMLDFGYYMFEKVFAHGEDITADPMAKGKLVWKKFAPRHPMDVKEWYMDLNGGPLSVDMWAPPVSLADTTVAGTGLAATIPRTFEGGVIQAFQRWINIPIDKLIVFTYDKEAGNIEGISLLRTAYKHWYYKDNLYKIDAIQKERHGIGIPVIQLPVGYSQEDKLNADALGRNLRTNERAHVVLPPAWILEFAELKGQPVDCMKSIAHHDKMIPAAILGQFLSTETTAIEEQHTIFLKATRFTADIVLDVMNKYAIPQLVQLNWGRSVFPTLYVKRIGEQEDWRTESFTLRNYVGAGIIVPDQGLEDRLRDEMGYPPSDPLSSRLVRETPMQNEQRINPAPTQEPGYGHQNLPNNPPGQPPTPNIPAKPQPSQPEQEKGNVGPMPAAPLPAAASPGTPTAPGMPTPPRVGLPRQRPRGVVKPNVGQGDRSGESKRRGQ
jgi:hypothetical protein